MRTIKEKTSYVALHPSKEDKELASAKAGAGGSGGGDGSGPGGGRGAVEEFMLPDGRKIRVSEKSDQDRDNLVVLGHSLLFLSNYHSLALSVSEHQRSCSIPSLSDQKMQGFINWLSIRSIEPI